MMATYENRRIIFNNIVKKYNEYVALYRSINNGSNEGITPFAHFYWHYIYFSRYATGRVGENRGY